MTTKLWENLWRLVRAVEALLEEERADNPGPLQNRFQVLDLLLIEIGKQP